VRLLLDATFVIDYLRGDPATVAAFGTFFAEGDEPLVNEIVVCEVRAGLRDRDVSGFEAMLRPMEFVQPGPETAMQAGAWRREAHERGHRLSLADSLIAACAYALDAAVLTRNARDFALTPVRVQGY
jgi:predicted nucleic acid-binding protein